MVGHLYVKKVFYDFQSVSLACLSALFWPRGKFSFRPCDEKYKYWPWSRGADGCLPPNWTCHIDASIPSLSPCLPLKNGSRLLQRETKCTNKSQTAPWWCSVIGKQVAPTASEACQLTFTLLLVVTTASRESESETERERERDAEAWPESQSLLRFLFLPEQMTSVDTTETQLDWLFFWGGRKTLSSFYVCVCVMCEEE